jgi:chemotaxis signal transduction protein/hemoglobin-like flavoprotein
MVEANDGRGQFVVCRVGETYCGIPVGAVIEILPVAPLTGIPQAPPAVLGFFNFRGRVVVVADFRKCLGFPAKAFDKDTRIVIVNHGENVVGLAVDAVSEVATVEAGSMQPTAGTVASTACLLGVVQMPGHLMLEIDYQRALDDGLRGLNGSSMSDESAPAPAIKVVPPPVAADEAPGLDIELLETSFALLAPRGEELVERFYVRLFETAPEARGLFPEDLAGQRRALLGALGMVVNSLRAPEKLVEYLAGLGARHTSYGAIPAHYDLVGEVLLATMAELAGDLWTEELESAWGTAYVTVRDVMLAAAAEEAVAA